MAATLTFLAIPSGTDPLASSLRAVSGRLWWCGAALLAAAALALAWPQPSTASVVPVLAGAPSVEPLAAVQAATRSNTRFGAIEGIRELAPANDAGPRRYEMTVRMRDGSVLVTQETGGARWRVGESFQLTGYAAATQP
jgi:hypothetical protein